MRDKYKFKVDFEAKQYIGIHLNWNYNTHELICSMKEYVRQALIELQHIPSKQTHIGPSRIDRPDYGAKIKYVN